MNNKKTLKRTFLVAFFAFAMLFSGIVFVLQKNEINVYADGTYSVTYDANGMTDYSGNLPTNSNLYSSGATVTVDSSVLTKDGYKCFGWATTPTGDAVSSFEMGTENQTLYAVWGIAITHSSGTFTYTGTTTAVANNSTYTNVTKFVFTQADDINDCGFSCPGNPAGYTIFAILLDPQDYSDTLDKTKTYKITLSSGGGNDSIALSELISWTWTTDNQTNNSSTTLPEAVVGEDYYVKINCSAAVSMLGKTMTVSYSPSDPTFVSSTLNINPYDCAEIKGKPTYAGTYTVTVTYEGESTTFTLAIKVKVKYDANGITGYTGTLPEDNNTYNSGASVTVSTATLSKSGYNFMGWNTNKDATTGLSNFTIGNLNATLYAIWELDHEHGEVNFGWELKSTFTGGALTQGNYCLTGDITLTSDITINSTNEVSLCLNGHKLNLGGYTITNNGTLNICDCNTNKTYFVYEDDDLSTTNTQTDIYFEGGYFTGSGCIDNKTDATLTLNNVAFYNCSSESQGVVYTIGELFSVSDCQFIKCNCNDGGAIYINANATIDNCKFYACSANLDGGAIHINYGEVNISDSTFSYCTAGCGGAIYAGYDNDLKLENCSVSLNTATESGGGLDIAGDSTKIIDCTITNNSAPDGAGVQFWCYDCYFGGKTIIYDNLSSAKQNNVNLALQSGGYLIDVDSTTPLTTNSNIGITIPSATGFGTFISGCSSNAYKTYFVSDNANAIVAVREIAGTPKTYNYNIEQAYSVVYNANDATNGSVPTNTNKYFDGEALTLVGNTGNLERTGYEFLGWALTNDATEALSSYNIDADDATSGTITLYAVWQNLEYNKPITITVSKELEYGVKKSDLQVSVGDSDLQVKQWDMYLFDMFTQESIKKSSVDVPGSYLFMVIVEGKTENYWFRNDKDLKYINTVTVANADYIEACVTDMFGYEFDVPSVLTGSEIFERYLGIFFMFNLSGSSVVYDKNAGDDNVENMPTDENSYLENAPVTISTDIPTRLGYKFLGWSLTNDGAIITTSTVDMDSDGITFYAAWQKIVKTEPTNENNYTVELDEAILGATYQWQKTGYGWADATEAGLYFCNFNNGRTLENNSVSASNDFFLKVTEGITSLRFKFTGTGTITNCTFENGYYYPTYDSNENNKYFPIKISNKGESDLLTDIEAYILTYVDISGENSATLVNSNENTSYRCVVSLTTGETAIGNVLTTQSVSFAGNNATTGTDPQTVYQLTGRKITLPNNPYTRTGYQFLNWTDGPNGYGEGEEYTVGFSNIVIEANWQLITYSKDFDLSVSKVKFGSNATNITVSANVDDITIEKITLKDASLSTISSIESAGTYNLEIILTNASDLPFYVLSLRMPPFLVYNGSLTANGNGCFAEFGSFSNNAFSNETNYENMKAMLITLNIIVDEITLHYDSNNATSGSVAEDELYCDGKNVTLAEQGDLLKTGYKFLGWALTNNATETLSSYTIDSDDATDEIITLYAVWKQMRTEGEITKKEITEPNKKPEDGTKVEIIGGEIATNIVVVIEKNNTSATEIIQQAIKSAVNEKSEVVAKFEIHLEDENGAIIENIAGNRYKITIVLPKEIQGKRNYAVVCIKNDSTVEKYDSTLEDNKISFETDHFFSWVIVADENSTNVVIFYAFGGIGLLAILLLLFVCTKRTITFVVDGKEISIMKLRPNKTIILLEKLNQFNWFTDYTFEKKFNKQKMGYKSIKLYGRRKIPPKPIKNKTT